MSPITGNTASVKNTENSVPDGSKFEVGKGFPVRQTVVLVLK